ncbi:MAG TPA: transketolase C-terminal domain-containing protein [Dehalococcoidales bacterium]|nr:transketolase C-terminal domain-containing protein [Dehalococcoidales bacterium]
MKVTFNFGEFLSARSVAGDTIMELGKKYNNVWALTADTGGALKQFKKDFPERYIDTGVAEQNLAGIAAGLALEGNIPFIFGMIPFMVMRACEQNRTAICYQDLPVRFIGTGGGLTSGGGSTHNAMEDISIMKSLVNMTVLSIGDPNMVRDIMLLSMEYPHPLYLRLAQGKQDRMIYEPGKYIYKIGGGLAAREGKDTTIFCHGEMVFESLEAADILAKEGINARVVDLYSIKPVDKELILKCAKETKNILVLEDHLMDGGLASTVADVFADSGVYPRKFKRLGIPQVYAGFGSGEELRKKYGYDKSAAAAAVLSMLK